MEYTKEVKLDVYKQMLINLDKNKHYCGKYNHFGMCGQLSAIDIDYNIRDFPELMKHCPDKHKGNPSDGYWFNNETKYGYYKRVNIVKAAIKELEEPSTNLV